MTNDDYALIARVLHQARATAASADHRFQVDRITLLFAQALHGQDETFDKRRFVAIAQGRTHSVDHP